MTEVRPFQLTDTEEIVALFQDTVRRVNSKDYSPEQVLAWAPNQIDQNRWRSRLLQNFSYVAASGSKIVGFANLEPSGRVDVFYVHADYQNQGVGKALMTRIESQAHALRIEKLYSEVSITARQFFEGHGFSVDTEQSVVFRSVRFTNFSMSKPLINETGLNAAIEASLQYLESEAATRSLQVNAYWPKWDSPWWHITLLNEMGLAKKIPERAIREMVGQLKASPLTIFPLRPEDVPSGVDVSLGTHCHCALGNIYQTLAAWGIDVDQELPWIRKWFLQYQLPDGGLNCDNDAYQKDSPPSSMVGTIAPLEAVLLFTPRELTSEEARFLDHGAQCLIDRELMHATSNPHNVEERDDENDWLKLCFPRFYLYDVLRGLSFILRWSDRRGKALSCNAIAKVIEHLEANFSDGLVKIGRHSFDGTGTLIQSPTGEWLRRQPATHFSLLDQVCKIGDISPYLTTQWNEAQNLMVSLSGRGLLK